MSAVASDSRLADRSDKSEVGAPARAGDNRQDSHWSATEQACTCMDASGICSSTKISSRSEPIRAGREVVEAIVAGGVSGLGARLDKATRHCQTLVQ